MALQLFKIASTTVESPVSTITFSSIPQGYTDLKLVISGRSTSTTPDVTISFNGVTTNLSDRVLYSYSGTAGSNSNASIRSVISVSSQTANTFGSTDVYIPNYTSANYKSVSIDTVSESNESTNAFLYLTAGLWSSTAAITSLTATPYSSNSFTANSTLTLYGIL